MSCCLSKFITYTSMGIRRPFICITMFWIIYNNIDRVLILWWFKKYNFFFFSNYKCIVIKPKLNLSVWVQDILAILQLQSPLAIVVIQTITISNWIVNQILFEKSFADRIQRVGRHYLPIFDIVFFFFLVNWHTPYSMLLRKKIFIPVVCEQKMCHYRYGIYPVLLVELLRSVIRFSSILLFRLTGLSWLCICDFSYC